MKRRTTSIQVEEIPTTKPGHVLEVTVIYSEGGINYWNGTMNNPKGIFVHVTPVELKPTSTPGIVMKGFTVGSGIKKKVEELSRYSEKKLRDAAGRLKADPEFYRELVEHVCREQQLELAADFFAPVA